MLAKARKVDSYENMYRRQLESLSIIPSTPTLAPRSKKPTPISAPRPKKRIRKHAPNMS